MQGGESVPAGILDSAVPRAQRLDPVGGPDPRTLHERSSLISALATGGVALAPRLVDLGAIVQQAADDYAANAIAAGAPLRIRISPVLGQWDPDRLRDIAVELIYNAITHAGGKPIDVGVGASDTAALLVVQDYGPGVPVDRRDALFDPAVQVSGARIRFSNGLWLCRTLAAAMDGTIELEPSPTGARFVVTLPRYATP